MPTTPESYGGQYNTRTAKVAKDQAKKARADAKKRRKALGTGMAGRAADALITREAKRRKALGFD